MHPYQNLPLRHKLTLLSLITATVAMLLSCAGLVAFRLLTFKQEFVANAATAADMIGFNSASALSFNDAKSAEDTLQALSAQSDIIAACIYDKDGRVFATYPRTQPASSFGPRLPGAIEHFGSDRLELFRPISAGGEEVGSIYLRSDFRKIRERLGRLAWIIGAVVVITMLVAYFLASRLQRLISAPISDLAAIVGRVAAEKDFSIRATKRGNDELGRLVDGFNEMLVQIEARDRALQSAHHDLEQRVADRTQELKRAQAEVAREKDRLQLIFESVPVGISLEQFSVGGGRDRLLNSAHLAICGLTREQAVEGAIQRLTHPDDFARQTLLREQLDAGLIDRFSLEKRYVKPDGQIAWVVFTLQRQCYADGSRQDLSTVVDITDLKHAQAVAAREQARFKFIFDSVPVGISFVVNDGGNTHLVNPAHERITGVSAADSGLPGVFRQASHPDDYRRQMELAQPFIRGEADHYSAEKRYLHADGGIVWTVLTSRKFTDAATGVVQSITTLVDITERKRAEESLRLLGSAVEQARESILITDAELNLPGPRIVFINSAYTRLTGYTPEEVLGKSPRIMQGPKTDRAVLSRLRKNLEHGEEFAGETINYRKDGSEYYQEWQIAPIRNAAGQITHFVAIMRDIAERKQAEATLEKAHRELVNVSRQAGMAEVATGVLHNVGNVLNSVNVSATLVADHMRHTKAANVAKVAALLAGHQADLAAFLTKDPRGQMIPGYLGTLAESLAEEHKVVLEELDHLRKNIEHIKDIVAMQQNFAKNSGLIETVPLDELVEDALRMNVTSLTRHDVELVRDFQIRPMVRTDKHKVVQILINLVRNAKHACDDTGRPDKRITVRIAGQAQSVQVSVSDNGVGIPAENLTRIFNHGFTTKKTGHGFGLHSGALAAKELGGALSVHSDGPGTGATFVLSFPSAEPIDNAAGLTIGSASGT